MKRITASIGYFILPVKSVLLYFQLSWLIYNNMQMHFHQSEDTVSIFLPHSLIFKDEIDQKYAHRSAQNLKIWNVYGENGAYGYKFGAVWVKSGA